VSLPIGDSPSPLTEAEIVRIQWWAGRSLRLWLVVVGALLLLAAGLASSGRADGVINALALGIPGLIIAAIMIPLALRRRAMLRELRPGAPTVLIRGEYHQARGRNSVGPTLGGKLVEHAAATPPPAHQALARARALALDPSSPNSQQSWLVVEWLTP
jgi:hypothetical protein